MVESALVTRRNEIQRELKLAQFSGIDPQRKRKLIATLSQLERDITAIGFSADGIKQNNFHYAGDKRDIQKSTMIVSPSFVDKNKVGDQDDDEGHRARIQAYRAEAEARQAAWEKAGKK
jgi:hypothetical protein